MAFLLPQLKARFFDANGDPLTGGMLYSYVGGTSTPKATFTDESGSVPNTNPVVLNASGEADVWIDESSYKFILKDSNGVTQWTVDDVSASSGGAGSGGGGSSAWVTHSFVDGQSATPLDGETSDSSLYSSVEYDFEVIRGITVFSNGKFFLQFLNGSWRVALGQYVGDIHGLTFSFSGTTIAQLRVAANIGAGNGSLKLSRKFIPA